jgi:hypothetical protein
VTHRERFLRLLGQGEELVCQAVEAGEQVVGDAVTGDEEETQLAARSVDLGGDNGRVAGGVEQGRDVDQRQLVDGGRTGV